LRLDEGVVGGARLGVLGAAAGSANRTLFFFLDTGVEGVIGASGSRQSFLEAGSSSSWTFLFRDGRTISILALRAVKGAGVCVSFPACSFESLLRLVVTVADVVDEASLPRAVRVLRVSTPGIVLAVVYKIFMVDWKVQLAS
jgi:hypothetical protein